MAIALTLLVLDLNAVDYRTDSVSALFGVSLLPFSTALVGEAGDNPLPVTLFSANLLLISLSLAWLARTAERAGVAEPVTDERQIPRDRESHRPESTVRAVQVSLFRQNLTAWPANSSVAA